MYKKYLYCARKSSFGPKIKALKISKNLKKNRPLAHFLAKAKDANQLFFLCGLTKTFNEIQIFDIFVSHLLG
jgi:hypothetical protein